MSTGCTTVTLYLSLSNSISLACVAGLGLGIGKGEAFVAGEAAYQARYASWMTAQGLGAKVGA